jgi:hypothetical protein
MRHCIYFPDDQRASERLIVKVWWSKSPKPGNFGDLLTPHIFNYFGIPYEYVNQPRRAEALCVGSTAKFAREGTIVLGTGTMREADTLDRRGDWRFVRGPYTRGIVVRDGGDCPEIYGDPALLLPLLQPPPSGKTHEVGVVPHYVDYEYAAGRYDNVINVLNPDPLEVARQIASCKKIVSSSLHGIIAAHAYGIPAAWVEFSNKLSGDGIKFADHFASVGAELVKSSESSTVFVAPQKINTDQIHRMFTHAAE